MRNEHGTNQGGVRTLFSLVLGDGIYLTRSLSSYLSFFCTRTDVLISSYTHPIQTPEMRLI